MDLSELKVYAGQELLPCLGNQHNSGEIYTTQNIVNKTTNNI